MKETGDLLRKIREEKGISIEEVVLATKIKKSTIAAIESGDLENLPSKTFIRGFVQSYAKFLHTDTERVLEVFYNEMGTTIEGLKGNPNSSDLSSDESAVAFANSNRHPLTKSFVIIGSLVLIIAIYFIQSTIEKYQSEKQLIEPTQEEAKNIIPLNNESDPEISTEANEPKTETATNEAVVENLPVSQEVTTVVTGPRAELPTDQAVVPVKNDRETVPSEVTSTAPTMKEEPAMAPVEESRAPAPAELKKEGSESAQKKLNFQPQEVILEALDEVKIEFRTDSGAWVDIRLKPEQLHTIKARNKIELRASDGGAINLIHNGKVIGVPGTIGSKFSQSYPN